LGAAAAASPLLNAYGQPAAGKKLNIALLGLGDYATKQLGPALKLTGNAKLAGIVTGSADKIPQWQKDYEIPDKNIYNYGNFDTIKDNKDIDVIYVVSPTGLHPEFAIRAAQAGKHVICEKPMAPTVEECTKMIDAAAKAGVTLQIGYRLHWDPFHLRLMEVIRTKEFGEWKSIEAGDAGNVKNFTGHNAWRLKKDLGVAGALYDLGVYAVQAAIYTAGMNPVSVTAKKSTLRPEIFTEVAETYEWTLNFTGDRKAECMSSYGQSANYIRAELEKGKIEISPAYGYGGQKGFTPGGPMVYPVVNQQALQIEGQVNAILEGKGSRVPGEMGRRDIRVLRGIMEAADTEKEVKLGDFGF
jgi:predicted dehydrogenase